MGEESLENDGKASYENMIAGKEIIDLKTNNIPRGLVPLERLFDNNDVYLTSSGKIGRKYSRLQHWNIYRSKERQNFKISSGRN